ncbi:hypothetical protein [Streptomyces sp. NPDC053560]|uniref:hypothetical protein n=1 Tax=Streptomyces sp. NPDC053560 TaxID=3365711 RepID=UPI0037D491B9
MPHRIAAATSLAGFALGASGAVTFAEGIAKRSAADFSLFVGARVFFVVACGLILTAALLRPWMLSFLEAMRRETAVQADQHQRFNAEMDRRLNELTLREEAVNRSTAVSTVHLSYQLAQSHLKEARLQIEYDELATDYNRVVTDTLQQRAMLFASRTGGNSSDAVAPCTRLPGSAGKDNEALPTQAWGTADPK